MSLSLPESEDLVLPHSGEVISLQDAGAVANALADIRRIEALMRDTKAILSGALVAESQRQGSKTLHLPGVTAEIRGGTDVVWDIEALVHGLETAGLPDERLNEAVRQEVTLVPNGRELTRIGKANPVYAAAIDAAKSIVEKQPYVVLRKGQV